MKRYGVRCHRKLEEAFSEQNARLRETIQELKLYKKQQEAWSSVLQKILKEQASLEDRYCDKNDNSLVLIFPVSIVV